MKNIIVAICNNDDEYNKFINELSILNIKLSIILTYNTNKKVSSNNELLLYNNSQQYLLSLLWSDKFIEYDNVLFINEFYDLNKISKLLKINTIYIDDDLKFMLIPKKYRTFDSYMSIIKLISKNKDVNTSIKSWYNLNKNIETIKSESFDNSDYAKLRQNRERHEGFNISHYQQSPPMLFTRDGHNLWLGDIYRGSSAYLILGGPSFKEIDIKKLNQSGILTMCVNNSVKTFRPNLWTSVDDPTHFLKSIWLDPKIQKFVPMCHSSKKIFDNDKFEVMDTVVGDCPNVYYYRRNEHFKPEQFLYEDTFNWGNHKKYGGGRSIMLVAIRLLYYLGIRKVYLLGCDFNMDGNTKYHFEQDRSESSIRGNNNTYKLLIERFNKLKPIFDDLGYEIYNCNKNSNLKIFPYIDFNESINRTLEDFPNIYEENSKGLYDRNSNKK